jgi:hypothetical protein
MNVHRTFLITAAVLVFAFVPSAQARPANAVPNPGFEEFVCGSSTVPDICAWDPGYGSIIRRDPVKPHSGNASLALVGFWGAAEAMSDPASCMPIGPGKHAASYWYRTGDASFVGFSVRFWTERKCTGSRSSSELGQYTLTLSNQWHAVAGEVVAPPGTASVSFGLEIWTACDACSVVSADFDDLMLEAEPLPALTAETER